MNTWIDNDTGTSWGLFQEWEGRGVGFKFSEYYIVFMTKPSKKLDEQYNHLPSMSCMLITFYMQHL